jgi:hypothetical protein
MDYRRPSQLSLCLAVALSFATAHAQQASPTTNKDADEALRQKAFDLLASIGGQLGILQSPENRARLGANLAESLWEKDERRARTLLMSVQDDINAGLRNQQDDQMADRQRRMVFLQLRVNTVERIAKYDGELALAFFKATASPSDVTRSDVPDYTATAERALELNLARQIAANSPEVALSLARHSLDKGFHYDIIPLLRQLNRKHPEQAATLYGEIMAKFKRTDLVRDRNALYFAQNFFRSVPPPATDDSTFRELMQMFASLATANGCNNKTDDGERRLFCYQVQSVIDSGRAGAGQTYRDDSSWYEELNEMAAGGSVDDMLKLTTKYPQFASSIYWRAVQEAQASGDVERARKLANEFVEPSVRRSLLELIDNNERASAEFRQKIKNLNATLETIPQVEIKIDLLLQAAKAIGPGDQKQALKLIDQAAALVESMKPGKNQLELQMGMALVYCREKDDRGIAIMESLLPRLNELVNAAAKLDGYESNHLRDGEWNMSNEGLLGSLLTGLAQKAPYFAWCDFDRAVTVAGQFERPEIRLMAQMKLAQGILAGRPKPLRVYRRPD